MDLANQLLFFLCFQFSLFSLFLQSCIASVGADGTVCVLSPHDRHVVIRARTGCGGFPGVRVHAISWRIAEMLLFILAVDGSLSIWDLASGQLERLATFSTFSESMSIWSYSLYVVHLCSCRFENPGPLTDELLRTSSHTQLITSVASPWSSLLATSFSPYGTLNANPANQSGSAGPVGDTVPSTLRLTTTFQQKVFRPPLLLQTAGSTAIVENRSRGPAAFVFHFDVEALISESFQHLSILTNQLGIQAIYPLVYEGRRGRDFFLIKDLFEHFYLVVMLKGFFIITPFSILDSLLSTAMTEVR